MTRWLTLFLFTLASLSLWIIFANNHHSKKLTPQENLDGYMLEARYIQYDNQGLVHTHLYTPKMTHYSEDSTSYFVHPEMVAYNKHRIPWTVTASEGKAISDGNRVELWGGVKIHQSPEENFPETTILTSAMTVYPHYSFATTDQPITITRPDTAIEAVGMEAHFKDGTFKLLSAAKGVYLPKSSSPLPQGES